MPEKINMTELIQEDRGNIAHRIFIKALVAYEKKHGMDFQAVLDDKGMKLDTKEVEISLFINCIEVPFLEIIGQWEKTWDEEIENKISTYIKNKVDPKVYKITDKFEELAAEIEQKCQKMIDDVFYEKDE